MPEWAIILVILLSGLLLVLATGLPVAVAFGICNIVALLLIMGESGLTLVSASTFSSVSGFVYLAIPLFVLMGEIVLRSGLGIMVFDALDKIIGRVPARLAVLTSGAGVIFAAVTGSSVASAATVGSLMLPEMKRRGYDDTLSVGTVLSVGPIAILIPPSGMMVVYSGISNIPLDDLLIGGILPGILLGVLTALFVMAWALFRPSIAPAYMPEPLPLGVRLLSAARAGLPLVFLIFCVVGTIYVGIATPTEAAATGALAAFVLAAIYRKLSWQVVLDSLASTAKVSGQVLFIITGSVAFGQIFALTGASAGLVGFVRDLAMPAWLLVMVLIGVVLILGGPLDPISIMFITLPIFIPLVRQAGLDPLWFSILMMIAIEIAVISPPSGGNLFVLQAVAPKDIPTRVFYWATVPFMGVHVLGLVIVALIPGLAVWLPSMAR